MQILKAQSRSELADRLRPTIKYKSKAIVAYFVFFITHSLLLIVFLYLFDWVKGQPYQLHWGYFIFSWIYAIAFAFPIKHKFSDYRIPFSFEKYFIDPALVQDLNKLEYIVKLLYYSYKIRKKLEITHRLSRSTILYAYV
jgi:hypothetical protein